MNRILDKTIRIGYETVQCKTFTEEVRQARDGIVVLGCRIEDTMTKFAENSV